MLLAQTPGSVSADQDQTVTVSGTWTMITLLEPPVMKFAGKNTFVELPSLWAVDGDLVGTLDCQPRATIFSTGESFVSERGEYTVTWGDYQGTMRVRSIGWLGTDGLYHLTTTIVGGGTGDLAKLRGSGTVNFDFNAGYAEYSIDVYWEE
jgi:hypothetical protein